MKEVLNRFWQDRSARERAALCMGGALVALATAYSYAWLPVARERERLLNRVPQLRIAAQEMGRQAVEIARLRSTAHPVAHNLKAAIERAAVRNGIALAPGEITPQGAEHVRVATPSVRASQWLDCIARLHSAKEARLESGRMVVLGEENWVKVEAVFVAGQ